MTGRAASRIATAGFNVVGVWDTRSGDLVFLAGHPRGVDLAGLRPDGRLLVTGGSDGRFRVWDAVSGATRSIHPRVGAGIAASVKEPGAE